MGTLVVAFVESSTNKKRTFLRKLAEVAAIEDKSDFFVFSQQTGQREYSFDCELTSYGIRSERGGEYFAFLGLFVEKLAGRFGAVHLEDE